VRGRCVFLHCLVASGGQLGTVELLLDFLGFCSAVVDHRSICEWCFGFALRSNSIRVMFLHLPRLCFAFVCCFAWFRLRKMWCVAVVDGGGCRRWL
jgi:hypothetical protein